MARLDGHRTAEQRSLAYHQRVAEKLMADPTVLARARASLRAQLAAGRGGASTRYALGWSRLIEGPVTDLVAFMTSDAQRAKGFRQASPFAGALDPRERWQLWREVGSGQSSGGGARVDPR